MGGGDGMQMRGGTFFTLMIRQNDPRVGAVGGYGSCCLLQVSGLASCSDARA